MVTSNSIRVDIFHCEDKNMCIIYSGRIDTVID